MDYVQQPSCPGFCGRVVLNVTSENGPVYSDCQACPWGTRAADKFLCSECTTPLRAYDYAFLVFHALVPLFINGLFINYYSGKPKNGSKLPRLWFILQILCAVFEGSLSLISSLLLFKPHGSFLIYGCTKNTLQEWYPMFYNPVINYTKTLRCTQEIVYPLFSLPYVNLAINLLNLLVFRSLLYGCASLKFTKQLPSEPFYVILWTLPIIALVHSFMSGLIYYAFPYIVLVCSLSLNAIYLATEGRKSVLQLLQRIVTSPDHIAVVVVHMLLLGFGFISLNLAPNSFNISITNIGLIVAAMPLPTCFYILTVRLTTPPKTLRYHR